MSASKWAPIGIAVVALSLLGYGAYAFLDDLGDQRVDVSSSSQRPLIAGTKQPKEYGLPEFPTAHAFLSADDGTPDRGSSAFSVRKGTAKEIAAFYREALPDAGWEFVEEESVKQRPGAGAVPNPPVVTGLRQTWAERNGKRNLRVLALDFVQLKSTAQAALSWSPASEADTVKP